MDYGSALERRVAALEGALIGSPNPGGPPGLVETQRMQGRDLAALRTSLEEISTKVDAIMKARNDEVAERRGEQRTIKRLYTAVLVVMALLGLSGGVLGSRILQALSYLAP